MGRSRTSGPPLVTTVVSRFLLPLSQGEDPFLSCRHDHCITGPPISGVCASIFGLPLCLRCRQPGYGGRVIEYGRGAAERPSSCPRVPDAVKELPRRARDRAERLPRGSSGPERVQLIRSLAD